MSKNDPQNVISSSSLRAPKLQGELSARKNELNEKLRLGKCLQVTHKMSKNSREKMDFGNIFSNIDVAEMVSESS